MNYTHSIQDGRCVVFLKGRFTFFDSKVFNAVCEVFNDPAVKSVLLNFKDVEFIDSAALGMLLMAREDADKRNIRLILIEPSHQVAKAFNVSEFGALFSMKE